MDEQEEGRGTNRMFARESASRLVRVSSLCSVEWIYTPPPRKHKKNSDSTIHKECPSSYTPSSSSREGDVRQDVIKGAVGVDVAAREAKTIDQFGPVYRKSMAEFKTPQAICGYVSIAVAYMIAEFAPQLSYRVTRDEVDEVLEMLNNEEAMVAQVREVMRFIQDDRKSYIQETHAHEFASDAEKSKYMKDWVANYEISDWLQKVYRRDGIHFVRNVERDPDSCEHEEFRRLEEEKPFEHLTFFVEQCADEELEGKEERLEGVDCEKKKEDKDQETEAKVEEDRDKKRKLLLTGKDWIAFNLRNSAPSGATDSDVDSASHRTSRRERSPVFVVDMLGHFVVMKPLIIVKDRATSTTSNSLSMAAQDEERTMLIINSTVSDYIGKSMVERVSELWWSAHLDD